MSGHTTRVAFLQQRLARFGLWGSAVFLVSLAVRLLIGLAIGELRIEGLDLGGHFGAAVVLGAQWLIARRGAYSERALRALDLVGMHALTISLSLMVLGIPSRAHPETVLLLALLIIFAMRVSYVPSSAAQATVVQLSATVWMVFAVLRIHALQQAEAPDDPHVSLRAILLNTFVWWLFAIAINAGASRVIYGLRERVREAEQLGQYTLEAKIGEGGMGAVYRARHALLRRPTAIKLLPPRRIDDLSVERFEREVQRTAGLTHPNIVSVFDYGRTPDGIFYYAMEYLDGLDLGELVARFGPQPPARVVHILAQLCDGLAAAHEVGLIHRDVKPANVFVLRSGRTADQVKIVDFGLVKEAHADAEGDLIAGTPQYMAPEAITDPAGVDARTDLYAVGALGYHLLSGEHVFSGSSAVEVMSKHVRARPLAPSERLGDAVPEALEEVILRCLEKSPEARPDSADALRDLLLSLEDVPPWPRERARQWWAEADAAEPPRDVPEEAGKDTLAIDLRGRR